MKKIVILFVVIAAMAVSAQEQETLFFGDIESGGFGGPSVKVTNINNKFAVLAGAYGGWLINHQYFIGGGGFGLVTPQKADAVVSRMINFGNDTYFQFAYGGLMLGYTGQPEKLFHYSAMLLIGGGESSYSKKNMFHISHSDGYNYDEDLLIRDEFFVLEPTIHGELNVASFMKVGLGFSYRIVAGNNLLDVSNSDLSGPSAVLDLKFGSF
ncbi:MAG: hypothetical protein ACM3O3_11340 [Syntrophothermus sp.]|nr:hypothetical protein [Ignavibacteriaceae bacterium]